MRSCLLVNPIFLRVTHPMTARHLALRTRPIEGTGTRPIAECLGTIAALAGIPVVDDHFHRHVASPDTQCALILVGSCCQPPMAASAIDRKRRSNPAPR